VVEVEEDTFQQEDTLQEDSLQADIQDTIYREITIPQYP